MRISRENYEIWFIDWLDGKLVESEVEELNLFLYRNPDLKDEFADLNALNLKTGNINFRQKEVLKKRISELPVGQFELLCAASAENDLSEEQQEELNSLVASDPEKRKTHQLFSELKLVAPDVHFPDKRKLIKTTTRQKIISIVLTGLSAAAVITVILLTGVFRKQEQPKNINTLAVESRSGIKETVQEAESAKKTEPEYTSPSSEYKANEDYEAENEPMADSDENNLNKNKENKGSVVQEQVPERISFNYQPSVAGEKSGDNLIAFIPEPFVTVHEDADDGRSNVGRFLAQKFRSGILKEEKPSDAPLKGYEIAEAGIDGINKLLGWEMALTKNTDDNGEVKSLYFSSRMLKFNTQVKNASGTE
ncbi:MAG TPA: hypothetical protein VHO46_03770 [Bacteroidales bacterium]|nr:hypothetical protein [Bacteroidales bacterium]